MGLVDRMENATGSALGADALAIDGAFTQASMTNRGTLGALQADLTDMETRYTEADANLLAGVDARAEEIEAEDVKAYATVEEAIQAGEETLHEGRQALKLAGQGLRNKATALTEQLQSYKLNVSEEISELDAMNIAENRTLFRNVGLLRAYLQRSFAVEEEMLDRERKRIDEERAYADRTFDEAELEVTSFSQEVSKLMNTDAFQMLKKIMQADEDVALVTRENEDFVQWLEEHEETSIPWMKDVLKALSEAHEEKLMAEFKKKAEEEDLARKEAEQTAGVFAGVEHMMAGANAAMSTDQFTAMRKSDEAMLNGLGKDSERTDAAAMQALTHEMATEQQVEQGHLAAADEEVQESRKEIAGNVASTAAVQNSLKSFVDQTEKQTVARGDGNEHEMAQVMDQLIFPDASGSAGSPAAGGQVAEEPEGTNATAAFFQRGPALVLQRSLGHGPRMHPAPDASSSFLEEGEASFDHVNSTEVKEWLDILKATRELSDNYTALRENHTELGIEITRLHTSAFGFRPNESPRLVK
jgi:hypothetical protein